MIIAQGYALGGTSLAEDQLGPYIQQAIDQVSPLLAGVAFQLGA